MRTSGKRNREGRIDGGEDGGGGARVSKPTVAKVVATGWLIFIFGMAAGTTGRMPEIKQTPYEWYFPFQILLVFSPFLIAMWLDE